MLIKVDRVEDLFERFVVVVRHESTPEHTNRIQVDFANIHEDMIYHLTRWASRGQLYIDNEQYEKTANAIGASAEASNDGGDDNPLASPEQLRLF